MTAAERKQWSDDARGEPTAKLWLFMLRTGGRWKSKELAKAAAVDGSQVCWLLSAMARNGTATKFEVPGKASRFTYGVTGACKIPRCVSLQEVADCVLSEAPDRDETPA